jgi:AraC family transcriptional regulator
MDWNEGPVAARALRLWREFRSSSPDPVTLSELADELLYGLGPSLAKPSSGRPSWVNDVCRIIEARFSEPCRLGTLADELDLHRVHLATTFRRVTGYSVGDYVRQCRLRCARARLHDVRASLSSIALDAGFSDQSHFTRTFKRFVGMTPTEFRRTLTPVQDKRRESGHSPCLGRVRQRKRPAD